MYSTSFKGEEGYDAGGLTRNDVIAGDRAALLYDLPCGKEAGDAVEAWTVLVFLRCGYVTFKGIVRVLLGR